MLVERAAPTNIYQYLKPFHAKQFYTSFDAPPFPSAGLTFLDQMVASIVDNNPADWKYG